MLASATGLLMVFSFDVNSPDLFFANGARTTYLVAMLFLLFAAMSMKNVLSYKTVSKINYTAKYAELKTSIMSLLAVFLFLLSPMFDEPLKYALCNCEWIRWVGCLLLVDAFVFFAWSSWVFGKKFYRSDGTPVPLKLVSSGPYAVIRHPRYLGLIAWAFATALVFNNLFAMLLAVVLVGIIGQKAHDEEVFMELEFGDAWLKYKRKTFRFFPLIY